MLGRMRKARTEVDLLSEGFQNAQPIEPEEMNFIIGLATAAATYKMPDKNPVGFPIHLDLGNGDVQTVKLVDRPMNRGLMAIKRHCGDDTKKFFSSMARFMALGNVYNDKRFAAYMREKPGDDLTCEVSAAIGHAAGVMPLDEHGNFDLDEFFAKAAEIKQTTYGDED